jgi:glutathione peroxidase
MRRSLVALCLAAGSSPLLAACPDFLNQDVKPLGKTDTVNLCERYAGKPMLIVNTASHCGFTPQFKGLEKLYKAYRDKGFVVAGFPSDDFKQEADSATETAKVCYVNYGVTFDMYAEVHVKGSDAHPLFRELGAKTEEPSWNFNKYLVDRDGNVVAHFGSMTSPEDKDLQAAIEKLL